MFLILTAKKQAVIVGRRWKKRKRISLISLILQGKKIKVPNNTLRSAYPFSLRLQKVYNLSNFQNSLTPKYLNTA